VALLAIGAGGVLMPKIEWDESLSVGNDEIDNQHKEWIAIFNNMHTTIMRGGAGDVRNIGLKALRAMQEYARYHFDFEEQYMRKMGYPDLFEHKRIHKDFDNKIYAYIRDIQAGELVLDTEILKIIKNWLYGHIATEDKKYSLHQLTENQ
jgi:hemerythrin-like metal-binding protein